MSGKAHVYGIAGREVVCDWEIEALEPFRIEGATTFPGVPDLDWRRPAEASVLYADRGWVGGRYAEVECHHSEDGFWIEVEAAGSFLVTADGRRIVGSGDGSQGAARSVDTILGPCLCLALALNDVFSLHAAGLLTRRAGAIALAGLAGVGKSTLAAAFGERRGAGSGRLGDDILPLSYVGGAPCALPRFPQLKLPESEQWGSDSAGTAALAAVVVAQTAAAGRPVRATRLSPRQAALAFIRHTVAGRLFDSELSRRHLDFVTRLAADVPAYELSVPRGLETVPEVLETIDLISG